MSGSPTDRHKPYPSENIKLLPIESAGGNTISAKLDLIVKSFGWWKAIYKLLQQVDAVHIRCPNNISILGLIVLQFSNLPKQAVYTGSWTGPAPRTYRLQRAFLKRFFNGPVAIYGNWPNQPAHIIPSFSPSYYQKDWDMETPQVENRIKMLESSKRLLCPVRLMSVGALNKNKNQTLVLDALEYLKDNYLEFTLDLIGDGPERENLERKVNDLALNDRVLIHGNVSHDILRNYYRQTQFVIQAPFSEGFGKVPIEAFFHGVIPILSDVDISSQIIGNGSRGCCFSHNDAEAIAVQIIELTSHPAQMASMIKAGRKFARELTLEAWQQHIMEMLNAFWKIEIKPIVH